MLFPAVLDDYISAENPVRFLDAFVAQLDVGALGFQRSVPADTGRPGYDPGDLLRLYLYGYLHRIRSSRRLEQETHRNVELMWLLRGLRPDFKPIADFRRDHPQALKGVCREFFLLCKRLDLFGGELLAIDGSKFRAVNARDRRLAHSRVVVRIVPYPACELPGTARVPSSHWLDTSSTKGDTWRKQIPSMRTHRKSRWNSLCPPNSFSWRPQVLRRFRLRS